MKICTFDGRYARFSYDGIDHVTTAFRPGTYVREDHSPNTPEQLCVGLRSTGNTVTWSKSEDPKVVAAEFAKDIGATLLSGEEYEVALGKMTAHEVL